MWVTNLPSVVGLKNIISICHSRWQIENKCFNEIVNTWNADHIYRHNQNAISAFILFLFIALNIFNIFFARNIKDKRIRSKTLLIDLIKAEYLLARWIRPIPVWAASYILFFQNQPHNHWYNYINNYCLKHCKIGKITYFLKKFYLMWNCYLKIMIKWDIIYLDLSKIGRRCRIADKRFGYC